MNAGQTTVADHDCRECSVQAFDTNEVVCIRCGRINPDETEIALRDIALTSEQEKSTVEDHNAGNALYDSITQQQDYVSRRNPGVAVEISTSGKDAYGKPTVKQLVDGYKAGLYAGKYWHTEKDPVTGEVEFVFSRYDTPTLSMFKQFAESLCSDFHLDTMKKSHIAHEIKRQFSQTVMSEMSWIVVMSACLKFRQWFPEEDVAQMEETLAKRISALRYKVITGCDKEKIKALKAEAKERAKVAPLAKNK